MVAIVGLFSETAHAGNAPMPVHTYGLFVGSNLPGAGQQRLKYAHRDAQAARRAFQQMGNWVHTDLRILLNPDKGRLDASFSQLKQIIVKDKALGHKTMFIFYYSGHSKAAALNLGADSYSLKQLRQQLSTMGATVTTVILDTCQAGAISDVKGAAPAVEFSYNSARDLKTEGFAILSSSSGSELSQESMRLKGSYFTHYLIVGLRGAADIDQNGVVTLTEAYGYAYKRTLAATSKSSVGSQHVVFETELKGKGELPMTWPGQFNTQLAFPSELEGEILVTSRKNGNIVAEIHKVAGDNYQVALLPGSYEAMIRLSYKLALMCELQLKEDDIHALDTDACRPLLLEDDAAKGDASRPYKLVKPATPPRREYVMGELSLGFFVNDISPYTKRLSDFGYQWQEKSGVSAQLKGAISGAVFPWLALGLDIASMDSRGADGAYTGHEHRVSWDSWRIGGFVRGNLTHGQRIVVPFMQFGGGFARADFSLESEDGDLLDADTFKGFYLSGGAGLQANVTRHFGLTVFHFEYVHALLVHMRGTLDEQHDNGGWSLSSGVRFGY